MHWRKANTRRKRVREVHVAALWKTRVHRYMGGLVRSLAGHAVSPTCGMLYTGP